jgi:hypothetical protein
MIHRVIIENELDPNIVKAMLPLGKRLPDFEFVLDILHEDAFIHGYKAGTTNESWTDHGKKQIHRFIIALRSFCTLMKKFDWKKKPIIAGADANSFYNEVKYNQLHNYRSTCENLNAIFEITTFYKYCKEKEAPCPYEIADFIFVWQKLDTIFFAFKQHFELKEKTNDAVKAIGN